MLAIFAMNLHAVCQPNAMQICRDIIVNSHSVVCVKALSNTLHLAFHCHQPQFEVAEAKLASSYRFKCGLHWILVVNQ